MTWCNPKVGLLHKSPQTSWCIKMTGEMTKCTVIKHNKCLIVRSVITVHTIVCVFGNNMMFIQGVWYIKA